MKEVDFKDRVPTHAGRVKLTPVSGQENTFDMVRADDPTVEGTPIDKATFDSIIQSRLTGRFYEPTVTRTVTSSRTGVTTNPLPQSGWSNITLTSATSGEYIITASSSLNNSYGLERATDGNQKTSWTSKGYNGGGEWWMIQLPTPIVINSIRVNFEDLSGYGQNFTFQGSTNGTAWVDLTSGSFSKLTGMIQYDFSNTNEYTYYRVYLTGETEYSATIIEFEIAQYSVYTYKNSFELSSGVPLNWTKGQRISIQTPHNISTAGTLQNTLNGKSINIILQSSRRYELVYNGTSFDAKEV